MAGEAVTAVGYFMAFVVCCFIMAIPAMALFRAWFLDQTISTSGAVVGAAVLISLMAAVVKLWGSIWGYLIVFLVLAVSLATPYVTEHLDRAATQRMYESDIAAYRRAVSADPANVAAWSAMGDAYMRMGQVNEAIQAYQEAMQRSPRPREEEPKLKKALDRQGKMQAAGIYCGHCQHDSLHWVTRCEACGQRVRRPPLTHWLQGRKRFQPFAISAVAAGAAAVGLTMATGAIGSGTVFLLALLIAIAWSVFVKTKLM